MRFFAKSQVKQFGEFEVNDLHIPLWKTLLTLSLSSNSFAQAFYNPTIDKLSCSGSVFGSGQAMDVFALCSAILFSDHYSLYPAIQAACLEHGFDNPEDLLARYLCFVGALGHLADLAAHSDDVVLGCISI